MRGNGSAEETLHAPAPGPSDVAPPRPIDGPPTGDIPGCTRAATDEQRAALFNDSPPPPLADSNPFVQPGSPCDGEMRDDPARDATRGGL